MAIIKLVGNKNVSISDEKAEKLYSKWSDTDGWERSSVVDLGLKNFVQLGQIKGIDFQMLQADTSSDERRKKYAEDMRDWNEYVEKCKKETVEQKANRIMNTFCKMLWVVRGNTGEIEKGTDVYNNLMIQLIDFFSKNPDEWHATGEVYGNLIPYGTGRAVVVSKIPGIKSIGEIMASPAPEKNNKQKSVCDICGKKFIFEGERPLFCPKCDKLPEEEKEAMP